jgi:thymidylate synthase (FAD)
MIEGAVKCLDHGFVKLLDVMGDDKAIVDAARISVSGENVKTVSEDTALIRYLMRHRHTTPFEMVEFKFMVKAPIFVIRQWFRHRTASVNEMSARYSELPEEYYVPEVNQIRLQAIGNNQGRDTAVMDDAADLQDDFDNESDSAFTEYQYRLKLCMSRELARINLPLSTYSQFIWKQNLHNLLHFLALRMDSHAQYEIRVFADALAGFVKAAVPITWAAFEDYRLNAMTLTAHDIKALKQIFNGQLLGSVDFPTKRELDEFLEKAKKLEFI